VTAEERKKVREIERKKHIEKERERERESRAARPVTKCHMNEACNTFEYIQSQI